MPKWDSDFKEHQLAYIFTTAAIYDWISSFMLKNDVMILGVLILIETLLGKVIIDLSVH